MTPQEPAGKSRKRGIVVATKHNEEGAGFPAPNLRPFPQKSYLHKRTPKSVHAKRGFCTSQIFIFRERERERGREGSLAFLPLLWVTKGNISYIYKRTAHVRTVLTGLWCGSKDHWFGMSNCTSLSKNFKQFQKRCISFVAFRNLIEFS